MHSNEDPQQPKIKKRKEKKIRIQQLKTIMHIYRLLYINLMVTTNPKSVIDTHTQKRKESEQNTKDSHQMI